MGISDTASLINTNIRSAINIGGDPSVVVSGDFSVPATGLEYASGEISTDYTFWAPDLSAIVSTSISVPAGDGSVVSLSSGGIEFNLFGATSSWRVLAENINGTIWEVINLEGEVNVNGNLAPFDFQGRVDGSLTYNDSFNYTYPSGFDPTSCDSADDSDNFFGFGIDGRLAVNLSGTVSNLRVTSSEITGTIGVDIDSSFIAKVKWPCLVVSDNECVETSNVNVSGNLNLERSGSNTRLYGSASFNAGNESENGDIDLVLNDIF